MKKPVIIITLVGLFCYALLAGYHEFSKQEMQRTGTTPVEHQERQRPQETSPPKNMPLRQETVAPVQRSKGDQAGEERTEPASNAANASFALQAATMNKMQLALHRRDQVLVQQSKELEQLRKEAQLLRVQIELIAKQQSGKIVSDDHDLTGRIESLMASEQAMQQELQSTRVKLGEANRQLLELQSELIKTSAAHDASQSLIRELIQKNERLEGKVVEVTGTLKRFAEDQGKAETAQGMQCTYETDTDKDGVADRLDLCPNAPPKGPVTPLGCDYQARIVLNDVSFQTGTAELETEGSPSLDRIAAVLEKVPEMSVEVAGYTDANGDEQKNLKVSLERAQAVCSYLAQKGVDTQQLVAKGYGKSNPLADNTTREGRARNRRVEIYQLPR